MSVTAAALPRTPAHPDTRKRWIVGPVTDLVIGCGAWTLPILLLTNSLTTSSIISITFVFYFLTVFCNNPHYMATIHRAYGSPGDFHKYKFFTVYITILLLLTATLTHFAPILLPYFFTIYLTWSPWHYTGQNFGIAMMYARRGDLPVTRTSRNLLYTAFYSSYAMWFLAIHSQFTENPYLVTLGIPALPGMYLQYASLLVFLACAAYCLYKWSDGFRRVTNLLPVAMLLVTQFFWFVFPLLIGLLRRDSQTAIYFTSGALAFMHCAQYLWITQYYARRDPSGIESRRGWSFWHYYGVLIIGGIALFVPGPWLISYAFNYDLFESYLIFIALVNLHHFILDGAIWKLRDNRIGALLLGKQSRSAEGDAIAAEYPKPLEWFLGPAAGARSLRYSLAVGIIALAIVDQHQFWITRDGAGEQDSEIALRINHADSRAAIKRARQLADEGSVNEAITLLEAETSGPGLNATAKRLLASLLLQQGRAEEARRLYRDLDALIRPDIPTQLNLGIFAAQEGRNEEAGRRFAAAVAADPQRPDLRLTLAEFHYSSEQYPAAIEQYQRYFDLIEESPAARPDNKKLATTMMNLGRALIEADRLEDAFDVHRSLALLAQKLDAPDLESLAFSRIADIQTMNGDLAGGIEAARQAWLASRDTNDSAVVALRLYELGRMMATVPDLQPRAHACLSEAASLVKDSPHDDLRGAIERANMALASQHPELSEMPRESIEEYLHTLEARTP